jgi:Tfp pilus assembly protein PilW
MTSDSRPKIICRGIRVPRARAECCRSHGAGLSLVELLVALANAAFAMAGARTVCIKARDLQIALDAQARLQETARYAMAIVEADLRMAGFWGLTSTAASVTTNAALTFPSKCGGASWITSASRFVDGANNAFLPVANCAPASGGARAGSDVLIVRRASAQRLAPQQPIVSAANRDRALVVSNHAAAQIFVPQDIGNAIPAGYATSDVAGEPPHADTRLLSVNAYYVSVDSGAASGYPALRRKTLVAGPDVSDEEIVAGVEDLQVQIGVDTNDDANVDLFVNPGGVPEGTIPVCVRVWLRVRAQERDNAYRDDHAVTYGDRTVPATGDAFRRLLVTKTIQLRNAGA